MNLQQMQLLQLKKLQEQLLDQTAQLSHVQGDQVKAGVDTDILASLQQLTNQLIVSKVCAHWSIGASCPPFKNLY